MLTLSAHFVMDEVRELKSSINWNYIIIKIQDGRIQG